MVMFLGKQKLQTDPTPNVFTAVTETTEVRKNSFWLTVSEFSVHVHFCLRHENIMVRSTYPMEDRRPKENKAKDMVPFKGIAH